MKITYSSVSNPRWANAAGTAIDCLVKADHVKFAAPFTASPSDPESHGREIFERCVAGEFGPIADFDASLSDATTVQEPAPVTSLDVPGWPEIGAFLKEINAENARGSYRSVVLVWGSLIDEQLGRILQEFFVDNAKSRDLIWNDAHSSAASFSGRMKLALVLGLIDAAEFETCNLIRAVRNAFAHEWNASLANEDFANKIKLKCRRLYDMYSSGTLEWRDDLDYMIRLIFGTASGALACRLSHRFVEAGSERRLPKQSTP